MEKRKTALLLACLLVLLSFPAAHAQEGRETAVGFYFDTVVTLTVYGVEKDVLTEALEECGRYEALFSKTVEGSDIWNINHAAGAPVVVDDLTVALLSTALEVSAASEGAFDITIAPAVALWDFTTAQLPNAEALAETTALIDYTQITIEGNEVTLPAGMQIDAGGIAKGYIADLIANFFREKGATHALLNLGGNVVVYGGKPDGSDWVIGIQDPDEPTGGYLGAMPLRDGSVVTSGIYERGFDLDGIRYHHILDPETGWPLQGALASVTILSESSLLGDALSTACFVLGEEKARTLLEGYPGVEALFITRDGSVTATEGLEGKITLLEGE